MKKVPKKPKELGPRITAGLVGLFVIGIVLYLVLFIIWAFVAHFIQMMAVLGGILVALVLAFFIGGIMLGDPPTESD